MDKTKKDGKDNGFQHSDEEPKKKKQKMLGHSDDNDGDNSSFLSNNNEYVGWRVPREHATLDRVDMAKCTPEWFYQYYISQRKPCILKPDVTKNDVNEWKDIQTKWRNCPKDDFIQYLKTKAGNVAVKAETRPNLSSSYGMGQEENMTFSQFLQFMSCPQKHDLYYLTTQPTMFEKYHEHETNDSSKGHNDDDENYKKSIVFSELTNALRMDFPMHPSIMGNLIPQSINCWIGSTNDTATTTDEVDISDKTKSNETKPKGTTSRLHHDYHDNLYFVIHGTKQFQLYSPADAFHMHTKGTIHKVHPNGLIHYQNTPLTHADGSPLLKPTTTESESKQNITLKQLEDAEEEDIDDLMEDMLDQHINQTEEEEKYFSSDDQHETEWNSDEEDDDDVDFWEAAEKMKKEQGSPKDQDSKIFFVNEQAKTKQKKEDPLHFCRPPFSLSKQENENDIDQKNSNTKMIIANINQGEMLYLPASWFHQVYSSGEKNKEEIELKPNEFDTSKKTTTLNGLHVALNYWFHPPDNLDDFNKPYQSDYWNNDWKQKGMPDR